MCLHAFVSEYDINSIINLDHCYSIKIRTQKEILSKWKNSMLNKLMDRGKQKKVRGGRTPNLLTALRGKIRKTFDTMRNDLIATGKQAEYSVQKRFVISCRFCPRTFVVEQNLRSSITGPNYKYQCKFCSERLENGMKSVIENTTELESSTGKGGSFIVVRDVMKNEITIIGGYV